MRMKATPLQLRLGLCLHMKVCVSVCVCVGNRHCDPVTKPRADCTDTLWMLTPLAGLKGLCVPAYVCSIISIVA